MLAIFLTLKSLHIIAVIAWMAGLLYLPRLFVYHADSEVGSAVFCDPFCRAVRGFA